MIWDYLVTVWDSFVTIWLYFNIILPLPFKLMSIVVAYADEGKIPWGLDEDGFPTAHTHGALQGRDFVPLKRGDPVLHNKDGSVTVYKGKVTMS